ncbi:MAG: CHAT domain-containing protein [Pirellulaceae bacterium]
MGRRIRFQRESWSAGPGDVNYDAKVNSPNSTSQEATLLADVSMRAAQDLRSGRTWDALPGFRQELDTVRSLFAKQHPDETTRILAGDQADKVSFLTEASRFGTLHLITHGYFEDPTVKSFSQVHVQPDRLGMDAPGPDPYFNAYVPGLLSGLALAGAEPTGGNGGHV